MSDTSHLAYPPGPVEADGRKSSILGRSNANAFADMMQNMEEDHRRSGSSESCKTPGAQDADAGVVTDATPETTDAEQSPWELSDCFATHPPSEERIARFRQEAQQY